MQMQMMKFMTLFIGFLFFKVASGLCLYFIASSLWSVAERKLLPKSLTAASKQSGGKAAPAPRRAPEKSGSNGSTRRPAHRKRQKRR
jgi:YidC/Oxa1 family membrane protein insertase